MGDNHVFGTTRRDDPRRLHFAFGRFWSTSGSPASMRHTYQEDTDPKSKLYRPVVDVREEDVLVNVDAWQGIAFQHFVTDCLPRLALIYTPLVEARTPLWRRAKVVYNNGTAGSWFLRQLGLYHRALPGIGWGRISPFVYRARLALYPQYDPAPVTVPSRYDAHTKVRHGVHPRGSLLPVQRALGVFESKRRDLVLFVGRPYFRSRSLLCEDQLTLLEGLRSRLKARPRLSHLKLTIANHTEGNKGSDASLERARTLFRDAAIVIGPHGGALANLVFCRPGTSVIELYPHVSDHDRVHTRTSKFAYYGLANAAGLDYWFIEAKTGVEIPGPMGTRKVHYGKTHGKTEFNKMLGIDPRDALDAVDSILDDLEKRQQQR